MQGAELRIEAALLLYRSRVRNACRLRTVRALAKGVVGILDVQKGWWHVSAEGKKRLMCWPRK
jgi:hypothetical protein